LLVVLQYHTQCLQLSTSQCHPIVQQESFHVQPRAHSVSMCLFNTPTIDYCHFVVLWYNFANMYQSN
jgi:hypothetical protein